MPVLTRILGAATAAYSVAIIARPALLAVPTGLAQRSEPVPQGVRTLVAGIGARDTAIGVAMMLAPAGPALRAALGTRVAADLGDAMVFGTMLPDRRARAKAAGFAVGWAALCALSALTP